MTTGFRFPFSITSAGATSASEDQDATIRGKIVQVLFTAPGERVHQPQFGCGLFNLVFEPNNPILAAAMEFTVRQALARWLRDEILVDKVQITSVESTVTIEVVYTRREDLSRRAARFHFT